jgi:hypothetical protein
MLVNNNSSSSLGDRDRAMFGGMYYPYWPYPSPFPGKDSEKSASSDEIKEKSSVSDLVAQPLESVKTQAGRIEEEATKDAADNEKTGVAAGVDATLVHQQQQI